MITLTTFDDLYVVSDIHMGGKPGLQILKSGPRLGRLFEHLASVDPNREIGLVINGDLVDSLAEDQRDGYIAVDHAESMMQRIYADPAFKPAWDGLAKFVQAEKRHLIFTLGNHDLEVSLPQVELSVRRQLARGSSSADGRIVFATRGTGYACQVGDARVFCTHGNESDSWNVVDHEKLREVAESMNAGRPFDPSKWVPNAGTRFVINVMNQVKRRHQFVDLLKPETSVVFPILLVLDPDVVKAAKGGLPIITDLVRGELVTRGLLSADAESMDEAEGLAAARVATDRLLGSNLRDAVQVSETGLGRARSADALLLEAEKNVREGRSPMEGDKGTQEGTLGWFDMVVDRIRGVDKVEALRRALKDWLDGDDTFDPGKRDDTFTSTVARVGTDVDFIVTGHTHLERAIQIEKGMNRFYYNSGTWVRLIKLSEELLAPSKFEQVWQALSGGTLKALDDASVDGKPLIADQAALVKISLQDVSVTGELFHVQDTDTGQLNFEPVANSQFTWR